MSHAQPPSHPRRGRLAASENPPSGRHATDEFGAPGRPPAGDGPQSGRRARLAALIGAGVLVLAGAVYVGGWALAGDTVPRRATVAGVALGGQSRQEAVATLRDALGPRAEQAIELDLGDGDTTSVLPAEAGLTVDWEATVERTGVGRSWQPGHMWQVLTGGGATEPVLATDRAKMDKITASVAAEAERDATNAALSYGDDGKVKLAKGVPARSADPALVEQALTTAFPLSPTAAVQVRHTDPEITTAEAEELKRTFADPAVSGPVTVGVGDGGDSFEVTPKMIARSITFGRSDGHLTGTLDAKKLAKQAAPAIKKVKGVTQGRDATWQFSGGRPTIVPSQDGSGVSRDDLFAAVQPALTKTGNERRGSVTITAVPAEFTTEDAKKVDVSGVMGQFTTYFPHADYRNTNLGLVAEKINGYVVLPGEAFSMNEVVGERSAENGFADGWVIQGNREVKEVGGGVSQGATTIFNAAFLSGLEDVEHHPHSLYYDRYPAGREATVYYGSLDLRFRNDTDHAVVIEAHRTPSSPGSKGSLTVKMWGTSPYDKVVAPDPVKSDYTSGATRTDNSPDCTPQAPGQGLTATFYRAFIKDGQEVRRDNYTWTYDPRDEITCAS